MAKEATGKVVPGATDQRAKLQAFIRAVGMLPVLILLGIAYPSLTLVAKQFKPAPKEAVTVKVQEPIPGDWEMVSESLKHVKDSAHTASWLVTVPSKETVTLTYRVRMKQ